MRRVPSRCATLLLLVLWPGPLSPDMSIPVSWYGLAPEGESSAWVSPDTDPFDSATAGSGAIDEMLRGTKGRVEQWSDVPDLVILTSVMQYHARGSPEYIATGDVLTDDEIDTLVLDLTNALRLLTSDAFEQFATIRRESVAPGGSARVIRKNQIVVGRYRDVQAQVGVLGFGGRAVRSDGHISGAALILDDDYDRTGPLRGRLRTHELGHALGFNHVESRESIMNPRIGPDATNVDRQIATIAYRQFGSRTAGVLAPAAQ